MSKTTFDLMKEQDAIRLEKLRKNGINATDYTYDERIPTADAINLAKIQNPELINDNELSIINEAKQEPQSEKNTDKQKTPIKVAELHTSTQTEKGEIDSEKTR